MKLAGSTVVVANSLLYSVAVDGGVGNIWTAQTDAPIWKPYGRPAPGLTPYIGAVADGTAVQAFGLGWDGNLYNVAVGVGGWNEVGSAPVKFSGGVGAVLLDSTPNAFAIGSDANLYWWNGNSWQSLGAPSVQLNLAGSIGATLNANDQLEVCAVGQDGLLYNIWQDGGQWGSWNSVGVPIVKEPPPGGGPPTTMALTLAGSAGLCTSNGLLYAFAVDTAGAIWCTTGGEGQWTAWQCIGSAGGGFVGAGSLGATATGAGVAIGAIAGDGNAYSTSHDGTGWSNWLPLGQPLPPQPIVTYSTAQLGDKGSITLGNSGPSVDGNSAFTVAAWIRLLARPSGATVISKGNAFTLGLASAKQISAQLGTSTPITVNVALDLYVWYFIAATYVPSGNNDNTGSLSIYLNGDNVGPAASQTGVADAGDSFVLGGHLHAQIASASVWSASLTSTQLVPSWDPASVEPAGLVASYWFTQGSGVDLSGNGNPVTLSTSSAGIEWLVPALLLDGTSYASPNATDGTNPGGSGPFSLHAWVFPLVPTAQAPENGVIDVVLLANGTAWATESLVAYLSYSTTTKQFTWTVQQGGVLGTTIAATQAIPPKAWSHVAATYDGTTLTLYVNGVAAGGGPMSPIGAIASPLLTIGAVPDGTTPDVFSNYFTGGIQALGVWSTCLSASEVAIYTTTDPSTLQIPGCTAFYRLAGAGSLVNAISSLPIAAYHGALLFDLDAGSAPPAPASMHGRVVPMQGRRSLDGAPSVSPTRETRPVTSLMTDEGFDEMIASYARLVEDLAPEQAARLKDLFEQNLYRGFRIQEAAGGPTPGMVTHELVGNEVVFYHHTAAGPVEVARMDATFLDPCTAWIIDVVAASVGLLGSVLGVSYSVGKLAKFLVGVWRGLSADFNFVVHAVRDFSKFATLPILIARALFAGGWLTSVVTALLSGYSWWGLAWVLANAVLQLVALFTTGGWWLAFMVAQLAASIAQLVWVIQQRPTSCNPGPVLAAIAPVQASAGGPDFTLSVGGSPFESGATVQWNGTALATTYLSEENLTAVVPAANIASAGTASITVTNPGTDPSNGRTFTVT